VDLWSLRRVVRELIRTTGFDHRPKVDTDDALL